MLNRKTAFTLSLPSSSSSPLTLLFRLLCFFFLFSNIKFNMFKHSNSILFFSLSIKFSHHMLSPQQKSNFQMLCLSISYPFFSATIPVFVLFILRASVAHEPKAWDENRRRTRRSKKKTTEKHRACMKHVREIVWNGYKHKKKKVEW